MLHAKTSPLSFRLRTFVANDNDIDGDTLTATIATSPNFGTVIDNGDGTWTYTPNSNFSGADSFEYEISDGTAAPVRGVIDITVDPNEAPVANDDNLTTDQDTATSLSISDLALNDSDPDGDALTLSIHSQPSSGSVVDNGDGTWTYTPNAGFFGSDSFTYELSDGATTDIATVNVTVNAAVTSPTGQDDNITIDEDTPTLISTSSLLLNDFDPQGDPLSITIATQPTSGTVSDNGDGTWTYTPDIDFTGSDSFDYEISDGNGGFSTATVHVTVTPVNDAPTTTDDNYVTDEGVAVVMSVSDILANDNDVDGDTLTATIATSPTFGNAVDNGDGTWTYSPNLNFSGTDSFEYEISDGISPPVRGIVSIVVNATNVAPVANDDGLTTDQDVAISFNLSDLASNDSDPDGDPLSLSIHSQPSSGSVVDNGDGTWTYTPNSGFFGTDTFTYELFDGSTTDIATVTVTVNATATSPIGRDDNITTNEDTPTLISTSSLLSNDFDPQGDPLTIAIATQPTSGTVSDNGNGTWTYTPDTDFTGSDSFDYEISDGNGGRSTATVRITVNPVNDLPVASDDTFSTVEDNALSIAVADVIANDVDPDNDPLTAVLISQPSFGTIIDNGNGEWTYTPLADFHGDDSFSYLLRDDKGGSSSATVSIQVMPANDNPSAVANEFLTTEDTPITFSDATLLANDFDQDGDSVSVVFIGQPQNGVLVDNNDGTYEYTPNANFNGSDALTYQIADGNGGTSTSVVRIQVSPLNDLPTANSDSYSVSEGRSLNVATGVLVNDNDVDGDVLTARLVSAPANGQLTLNPNGSFVYVHDGSETTVDSFQYEAVDSRGAPSRATVTISIEPANDPPVSADDVFVATEDTILSIGSSQSALSNDIDADGDPIAAAIVRQPLNGSVDFRPDGTFTYIPNENFSGLDSFEYEVTDENGDSSVSTVRINVAAVNDAPVAVSESFSVEEAGQAVVGNLLTNDIDVDGDNLTTTIAEQPLNGSVTLLADGTFRYTPDPGFTGSDEFTYTVTDGESTSTATVDINVAEPSIAVTDSDLTTPDTGGTDAPTDAQGDVGEGDTTPTINPVGQDLGNNDESEEDKEDDVIGTDPRSIARNTSDSSPQPPTTAETTASSGGSGFNGFDDVSSTSSFKQSGIEQAVAVSEVTQEVAQQDVTNGKSRLLDALTSNAFIEGLDSVAANLTTNTSLPEVAAGTVVMATSTLSVGYFLWVVRTGYFVASCLSASPAWQSYDPLPIMASVQNAEDDLPETDQDRELEAMMGNKS